MIKIHKFGGSNFISYEGFNNFLEIIKDFNDKSIIVISALGKTTRKLYESAILAEKGDLNEAFAIVYKLLYFTHNLAENIIQTHNIYAEATNKIDSLFDELKNYLKNIAIINEVTPRILDIILSFGEEISAVIFKYFLIEHNVNAEFIDAKEIFITDDNFNKATPLENEIRTQLETILLPKFEHTKIVITQGFIGKTKKGDVSTMGFESSNLTALVLAKLLNSPEITIWTDVEGVFNADPNYFAQTYQLEQISYEDALKAAKFGNKLFYPLMIEEANANKMTILYKSLFKPFGKYTAIAPNVMKHNQMINFFSNISYSKTNKLNYKPSGINFFPSKNDYFFLSINCNDTIEIYSNSPDMKIHENTSDFTILALLNYHILDIYKRILNYNDLFTTYNFKIISIEESVTLLILKDIDIKELNKLIEKFI
jgi:aspartate kinase